MNTLIIETSTAVEFISVTAGGKTHLFTEDVGKSHSKDLFSNMETVFRKAGITVSDIELIGAGIGPGSFTGVRIGVSTSRMLAQLLSVPLVGIISHDIYASSVKADPGSTILVAFDAKKGRVFGGLYRKEEGNEISVITEVGDYNIETLTDRINDSGKIICVGDGCGKFIDSILSTGETRGFTVDYIEGFKPENDAAALLAIKRYTDSPEKFSDYNATVPFYARKSDAEIARDSRNSAV